MLCSLDTLPSIIFNPYCYYHTKIILQSEIKKRKRPTAAASFLTLF
ncbi:hypothetical protein BAXH7_00466 [Bacillus amyloliquefaciens XH7]|nr:hypothetical protein LL3_00464 [Bacillus amyloliquefaciens LL3]AEK87612.1 hypothetical protein BAXH7_00466 [Bacillus amyloliquefaciens XH7]